eukprot:4316759-Pleurochrysis_carterae.AAC.3
MPPTQGLNDVRRTRSGQPAHCSLVARPMRRSANFKEQGGKEVASLRRRERVGVVSCEEGNRLTHTCLDGEGQLEVSERFCRVARHIDVGKSNRRVAPDLACRIAFALARGNLAPVSRRETLKLLWRRVRKPLAYRTHMMARRLARRSGASGKAEEAMRR